MFSVPRRVRRRLPLPERPTSTVLDVVQRDPRNRPVVVEYGGSGVGMGVAMEFMDRLARLKGLRIVSAIGASSGAQIATADALDVDIETKRDWVRRMPVERLASARTPGVGGFVEGIKAGGFVEASPIVSEHIGGYLRELSAARGHDVTTIGATRFRGPSPTGLDHRLQIAIQIGTQSNITSDDFDERTRMAVIRKACETVGIDVERELLRAHFPRIQQVPLPLLAEKFGFGDPDSLDIADLNATTIARVPFLTGVVAVSTKDRTEYVMFDGASGIELLFNPDKRIRDINFQRLPRVFTGPNGLVSPVPVIGVRVGAANSPTAGSLRYEGDPARKIPPSLVYELPSRQDGVLDFGRGVEGFELDMQWGADLADLAASTPELDEYIAAYPDLLAAYQDALDNPTSDKARRSWYSKLYELGRSRVSPLPSDPAPGDLVFDKSSLRLSLNN